MTVRQIQSREFSKRRRTILLLLGEKAGMREVVNQKRTGRSRKRDGLACQAKVKRRRISALRILNSALATDSFPEFFLGWTIGASGV